jgi:hypothetical protein
MSQPALSVSELEAQIESARARLQTTVEQLAVRAQPKEIVRRQTASARAGLVGSVRTPDGALRMDRVAVAAAAVVAFLGLILVGRRRRRR